MMNEWTRDVDGDEDGVSRTVGGGRFFGPFWLARGLVLAVTAACVAALVHMALGASASAAASSVSASITPIVFLTHGPAITHAVAVVAQGAQAWASNAVAVAGTAAASVVSGGVGYSVARAQAVAELSELRRELDELRGVLREVTSTMTPPIEDAAENPGDAGRHATATRAAMPLAPSIAAAADVTGGTAAAANAVAGGGLSTAERAEALAQLDALRAALGEVRRRRQREGRQTRRRADPVVRVRAAAMPSSSQTPSASGDDAGETAARMMELEALKAELDDLRAGTARDAAPVAAAGAGEVEARASSGVAGAAATSGEAALAAFWAGVEPTPPSVLAAETGTGGEGKETPAASMGDAPGDDVGETSDWARLAKSRAVWIPPGGKETPAASRGDAPSDDVGETSDWARLAKSRAVWTPPGTASPSRDDAIEAETRGMGQIDAMSMEGLGAMGSGAGFGEGVGGMMAALGAAEWSEAAEAAKLAEEDREWRRRLRAASQVDVAKEQGDGDDAAPSAYE